MSLDRRTGACRIGCYFASLGLVAIALWVVPTAALGQVDVERTRNPHGPLQIACEICHTSTSWTPLRARPDFDHLTETGRALIGAHADATCTDCHSNLLFAEVETSCSDCHADIHRRQFGASCENCHSELGWQIPATAVDAHLNRFPLQGAHAAESCDSCHSGGATAAFTGVSTLCVSCHAGEYETASIDHVALGFPTDCENCHTPGVWQTARFDHAPGRFPLTGAHVSAGCESCHLGGQFDIPLDTACVSCHLTDFNGTTNPNHVAASFPDDCALCHSTAAWIGAGFAHDQTQFPLTGAHVSLQCETCHVGGQYVGLDTQCIGCHDGDFTQTTAPNHLTAGFSTACELCHNTSAWPGVVFDHSTTRFPLLGAHTTATCVSCHVGDVYAGTPTDCYSCHSSEYQSVTDPNHMAAGFPTTCESCHNENTWSGAQIMHAFPIYSGAHAGRWPSCATCHTNPSNYSVFTCFNCHQHNQTDTNARHSQVGGYVYESNSCYSCHPNGRR